MFATPMQLRSDSVSERNCIGDHAAQRVWAICRRPQR